MDKQSPWALAPPRDLDKIEKVDPPEWDSSFREIPTFQPELVSAPDLREKAKSSGYGKVVPTIQRADRDPNDLRPGEEEPPFKPQLPRDAKRDRAHSSSYGKVLAASPKPKDEGKPSFRPEIKRSSISEQVFKQAKSSAYGKVLAEAPRPQSAPTSPFRPQLPPNKLRQQAQSSAYGKVLPASRPTTANGEEGRPAFDSSPIKANFVPRYSVLADRSHRESLSSTTSAPERDFVLDGVHVTSTRPRFVDTFGLPKSHKPSPSQLKLRESASSSQYGKESPKSSPRPEPKPSEPRFVFGTESVLSKELPPHPPKTPLADKVRSNGYGTVAPAVAPKPEPKPQEPKWGMTYKAEVPKELPPPPRSSLNDKVGSHGYGKVSPQKAPRYEIQPEPLWVPTNNPSVKRADPAPVPRPKSSPAVRGHYGKDYNPTSLYAFNSEGEFDEGEQASKLVHRTANGGPVVGDDVEMN